MKNAFPFKQAVFAAAAAATLLLTGCAAPNAGAEPSSAASPAVESSAASSASTATATPTVQAPAAQPARSYTDRLSVGSYFVKAGENLHVYGGTMEPGLKVQVYAAQQMAMPSQDATGMWHQVGDEVKVTETATVTVNDKGQFDLDLLIPAGTPPQLLNVQLILPDGNGSMVQTTVQ
jgi:hypothetical protein